MENRYYQNPVVRGFHPDPSVIRVGEDYYMANSTFQYFPAVILSHSRDLVHWETIGHAINDSDALNLADIADSHGIWAPDLSYHDGIFYLFATLRLNNPPEGVSAPLRVQLLVTAACPEGPYSNPVRLAVDTIDPSLFVDDDGARYLVVSPGICVARLSKDCTQVLEKPVAVWEGTGRPCPEGPRIFKKDGWYYALLAEGGTGYGHCITVARSRRLYGPYDACPFNPVFTQSDPKAQLQRCGHGQLIETHKGDDWMFYLCGRTNGGNFTTLGRETALDPVQWTEDGWFEVNGGKGPSACNQVPNLPDMPCGDPLFDDFNNLRLSPVWQFIRNPDDSLWSLAQRQGFMRLFTSDNNLDRLHTGNTILRREEDFCYTATVRLSFFPEEKDAAGLVCYYGVRNHIEVFCTCEQGVRKVVTAENRNGVTRRLGEAELTADYLYLRVRVQGQRRFFFCGADEMHLQQVAQAEDCTFLSDEGVAQGKHHTGTFVGIFAYNTAAGRRTPADFDWFRYERN